MEIQDIYTCFLECGSVTTDSRKCGNGLMFFALKGERFDGNTFVRSALEQGCNYAVMDDAGLYDPRDSRMILVDNVLKTLQQLAAFHRRKLGTPVIGITGTNGKTTTKELTAAVMSSTFDILCTQGNLNNSIGVPLTVLGLDERHDYAIVEMGASHPGDIEELVNISQPDCGLITNVGMAHLLGFGSFEGVKKTKGELYDWLRAHGGFAFVNRDNPHLQQMAAGLPVLEYGKPGQDGLLVQGEVLKCNPYLEFRWRTDGIEWQTVKTNLIGAYNVDNCLAALSVGMHFGVSPENASEAIAGYVPSNNRSQLTVTARNRLVVDAYNANPSSMAAAIENFRLMQANARTLILGDMRELGDAARDAHISVLEQIEKCVFTEIFLVGDEFAAAFNELSGRQSLNPGTAWHLFTDAAQLYSYLEQNPLDSRTILVKGSNSMRLTTLLPVL